MDTTASAAEVGVKVGIGVRVGSIPTSSDDDKKEGKAEQARLNRAAKVARMSHRRRMD
jgi:hypothetical protein